MTLPSCHSELLKGAKQSSSLALLPGSPRPLRGLAMTLYHEWRKREVSVMALQKIGEHIPREEDFRLLKGKGRYVADLKAANEAQAYVLRSPHAHARIRSLDVARAQAAPGVLAVLTAADLQKRGLGNLKPFVPRKRSNGQ